MEYPAVKRESWCLTVAVIDTAGMPMTVPRGRSGGMELPAGVIIQSGSSEALLGRSC